MVLALTKLLAIMELTNTEDVKKYKIELTYFTIQFRTHTNIINITFFQFVKTPVNEKLINEQF